MFFTFLHLLLDLYLKFLKQVAKHLNYFSYIITNNLNSNLPLTEIASSTAFSFACISLLQAILRFIKLSVFLQPQEWHLLLPCSPKSAIFLNLAKKP